MSSPSISADDPVAIASTRSPTVPLAVGRMLLSSKDIKEDEKGKAVHVLHTWRDTLWQSGSKADPPSELKSLTDVLEEISDEARTTGPTNEDGKGEITSGIAVENLSLNRTSEPGPSTEMTVPQHIITSDGASPSASALESVLVSGLLTSSQQRRITYYAKHSSIVYIKSANHPNRQNYQCPPPRSIPPGFSRIAVLYL